eukprot:CAMPEP_0180267344 /NCGR_PEP_ID=MMETSP0988-20121125/1506_1 /TAXON_ID=697907 /ORGANISM="non described non described, Strain CCMP2293" /LENGTH=117 /DNA_ID=CAMNT_0022238031 /DNA_START=175 /DNA_END=528 /DNA_ORIENTATION=-
MLLITDQRARSDARSPATDGGKPARSCLRAELTPCAGAAAPLRPAPRDTRRTPTPSPHPRPGSGTRASPPAGRPLPTEQRRRVRDETSRAGTGLRALRTRSASRGKCVRAAGPSSWM